MTRSLLFAPGREGIGIRDTGGMVRPSFGDNAGALSPWRDDVSDRGLLQLAVVLFTGRLPALRTATAFFTRSPKGSDGVEQGGAGAIVGKSVGHGRQITRAPGQVIGNVGGVLPCDR